MWKPHRVPGRPSERVSPSIEELTRRKEAAFLSEQIERLALQMERSNFYEYVQLVNRPRRLIFINLISGTARGVGIGIGFTIIAATLLYLLQALVGLNLPFIGSYIAEIVKIVQAQLHTPSY